MNAKIAEIFTTLSHQEKVSTLYQQASTHNALLKISRNKRQRQHLERRQAWNALWLAVHTLICLELSGSKHAQT